MKLVYFDCQGLGEISRIIFAITGNNYEDSRYPLKVIDLSKYQFEKKEFDEDKANGKLVKSGGKVPYLEVEGEIISQSKAIERFLARRFNLLGSNEIISGQVDAFCEGIRDIKDAYFKVKRSLDGDKDKWIKEELSLKLDTLLGLLPDKQSIFNNEFLFENKLSLADISIYHFVTHFFDNKEDSLEAAKKSGLQPLLNKLNENPNLKNWLETRPKSNF